MNHEAWRACADGVAMLQALRAYSVAHPEDRGAQEVLARAFSEAYRAVRDARAARVDAGPPGMLALDPEVLGWSTVIGQLFTALGATFGYPQPARQSWSRAEFARHERALAEARALAADAIRAVVREPPSAP